MYKIMKNPLAVFCLLSLFALGVLADGTNDVAIGQAVEDVTATWGVIKTALIAIGVFVLAWRFFKRLGRA